MSANWTPAHFALRNLASAMAFADNTWGEDDLYPVTDHLGLDMRGKWRGDIPDRDQARAAARDLLLAIREPAVREKSDRLVQRYLR